MPPSFERLRAWFAETGGALVAFSGGVDSGLLVAAAGEALGERALAVTARSPLHPPDELAAAAALTARLGVRHRLLDAGELSDPRVVANTVERCYLCKRRIFERLQELGREIGLPLVAEGSHADDLGVHRPGMRALAELGVRSPYLDLGFDKVTIRRLSHERGLPSWDRPSAACLASRIPYGVPLTLERLGRVARAEQALAALGFERHRVRDHEQLASVELEPAEFSRLLDDGLRARLVEAVRAAGYVWVTLDLRGLRSGTMDEAPPDGEAGR